MPQLIPGGSLVTVPPPVPLVVTVSVFGPTPVVPKGSKEPSPLTTEPSGGIKSVVKAALGEELLPLLWTRDSWAKTVGTNEPEPARCIMPKEPSISRAITIQVRDRQAGLDLNIAHSPHAENWLIILSAVNRHDKLAASAAVT